MDSISGKFGGGRPRELLFADHLVVIAERELQENWLKQERDLARHGLNVNTDTKRAIVGSKNSREVMSLGSESTGPWSISGHLWRRVAESGQSKDESREE